MKLEYIYIGIATVVVLLAIWQRKAIATYLRKPEVVTEIRKYCIAAENYIVGTKKGHERLELVCNRVYDYLPTYIKTFTSKAMLIEAVEYTFKLFAQKMGEHTVMMP